MKKALKGDHDYKRGIRGYTASVGRCMVCQKLCNTFWQSEKYPIIKPSFTCSTRCADKEAGWRGNK